MFLAHVLQFPLHQAMWRHRCFPSWLWALLPACWISRTLGEECASGYVKHNGDIDGYGSINGKGGNQLVSSCNACAQLCDTEVACLSYECVLRVLTKSCSLNRQDEPTPGAVPGLPHICLPGAEQHRSHRWSDDPSVRAGLRCQQSVRRFAEAGGHIGRSGHIDIQPCLLQRHIGKLQGPFFKDFFQS